MSMRTPVQDQSRSRTPVSSGIARRGAAAAPARRHRGHPILQLQRVVGNQAVQRVVRAASGRFAHDAGGIPVESPLVKAAQAPRKLQVPGVEYEREADQISERVMAVTEPRRADASASIATRRVGSHANDLHEAPAAVTEVVRGAGEPLLADTRAFMEPRFGHDFSRVRVHRDAKAARAADAVNARAYVIGSDMVFGRGEYAPGTGSGRSLIAHELAHVVQQPDPTGPDPALQRAPKKARTAAGEFVAEPYDAIVQQGYGDAIVGYGTDITIKFKANDRVDAEKIAFVQTALSVKNDMVHNKHEGEKRKTAESRMIAGGRLGAGVHIDQSPDVRTPLYGMSGAQGDDLASPEPAKTLTEIGWHYTDAAKKRQHRDAMMHDEPHLNSGDIYTAADDVMSGEWQQRFETTALAIAGNQTGTFYGSVEWGWTKRLSDAQPLLLPFKTRSEELASPTFMEAAKLWNASVTSGKKESIDLPVDLRVTSGSAPLWDSPDKRRKIATLTRGTPLGRTARVDQKGRTWWASVVVTAGPNDGKTGWVMEVDLA
jgi:hypothetical protein